MQSVTVDILPYQAVRYVATKQIKKGASGSSPQQSRTHQSACAGH